MTTITFRSLCAIAILVASSLSGCRPKATPQPAEATKTAAQQAPPATAAQPASAATPTTAMPPQMQAACPMVVPGTKVTVADTDKGVALDFATSSAADVATLREHVTQMSKNYAGMGTHRMMWRFAHGRKMGEPMGKRRAMKQGFKHGMGWKHGMPGVTTKVEETPTGARLAFTPTDPSQLDALRKRVRWHQERMQAGQCWMLQPAKKAEEPTSPPATPNDPPDAESD